MLKYDTKKEGKKMNAKHGLTLIFIVIVFTACTQDPIVKEYPKAFDVTLDNSCLLYTSPSPRDRTRSRMPSSA